ncbi:arginase [Anaerococcus sp. AGMB00486]|uniref:Arginase n=1 Tax=Anaerococcus faecalis TaxID=2742993 RepID=A0ABX2NCJ6_9FIRM|nr:arginase [Anaerococcus faecalis]NVF12442.1 arginase [Anaerococcus faecalis]
MKDNISVLGIPIDLGASTIGTRLGPDSIRLTGLLEELLNMGLDIYDFGNIDIKNSNKKIKFPSNMTNEDRLLPSLSHINEEVEKIYQRQSFPLILGGDHSLVLPSFKAFLKKYKNPGLIYIDAHADINTEKSSPTGNVHGMPVAALMGLCSNKLNNIGGSYKLNPQNLVYIAIRDIDKGEELIIKEKNIKYFSMADVYKYGIEEIVRKSMVYLGNLSSIYLSFDIDSMDCDIAPGTGVPVRGGLNYNQARLILSLFGKEEKIRGFEFVEVNPSLDDKNKTSEIAKELILAFFGKSFI